MWPYWVLFLIPALMAVQRRPRANALWHPAWSAELWFFWFFLVLLIGMRYEVGVDWDPYLRYFNYAADLNFWQIFVLDDPGYIAINWLSGQLGLGITGVNLISGAIFASGLVSFSRTLPRPWLALTIAVPFMVIVVAMSLVRQGVALGLVMTGLIWLQRGNYFRYLAWVLFAAAFHKTAIIMTPFALLITERKRFLQILMVVLIGFIAFISFLQDSIGYFIKNYLEAGYDSDGAFIRLLMTLVPALILLIFFKSFDFNSFQKKIWVWVSILAVLLFAVLFISPSSAAVDRLAIYFLPLQLVVFASLPDVFSYRFRTRKFGWTIAIILYYASVQFVWLTFATHAGSWIPYRIHFF